MQLSREEWAELRKPFPPESIDKLEKGGVILDYVGHAEVTERLNDVDPEWTWDFVGVSDDGGPLVRVSADGKVHELWITMTVGGVTRPAVGTAKAEAWSGEIAKELISDGLRNGAMRFGVALNLWKKHDSVPAHDQNTGEIRPPAAPVIQRAATTSGKQEALLSTGQSKNLYRLSHYVLKLDKVEYLNHIFIATGLEVESDRELSSRDASKVIVYLKELAGEPVDQPRDAAPVVEEAPAPGDELFDYEPF